jgi:hypothetical protein
LYDLPGLPIIQQVRRIAMAKKHLFITFILIAFYGCDVFNIDENAAVYPSKLAKLEMEELIELNQKFQTQNDNICSTLNEYGLTGYSTVLFDEG